MNHPCHYLHSAHDLAAYGVQPLTGESDAYGRRVLCDLNEAGVILLTAYFGLSHTIEARHCFPRNWNSMVGAYPAVASVLLPRAILPDLCVYALLHVGAFDYVMQSPAGFTGFNEGDRLGEQYLHQGLPEGYQLHRNEAKQCRAPQVDGRHVHAMSGRVL